MKTAIADRHPRESFEIADKMHFLYVKTPEEMDRVFFGQLKKTGLDYFDYYLIHGVSDLNISKYENLNSFNWLEEKKAAGLIRHTGMSFHGTPDCLEKILTEHPELEYVQLQINYHDWDYPMVRSRECYEVAARYGKKIIIMEPCKGGNLAKLPEEAESLLKKHDPDASCASWAMRFAGSLPNVEVVLSGMSSDEMFTDNAKTFADLKPLSAEERALTEEVSRIIDSNTAIACTGCSYCTAGCPIGMPIPQYFELYNALKRHCNQGEYVPTIENEYIRIRKHGAPRAMEWAECGACEGACPQGLKIIEGLKAVAEHFDAIKLAQLKKEKG